MNKFIKNLKKYYILLLNAVVPLIIFFIPVYFTNYVDEIDTITYSYNFYKLLSFNQNTIFATFNILLVACVIINLILFVINMCDSYKLIIHKNMLNRVLLTFSYVLLISSVIVLIYAIYISTISSNEIFVFNNYIGAGSILMLVYALIQNIITTLKFKRNKL